MSSSRYPDNNNNRYPRERSPYRDRRASTYSSGYPPRGNDSISRPSSDAGTFPPRDVPRGPKSLVDVPRAPTSGPPAAVPSGPRDGRGRGLAGRGDAPPSLRDAPPLSSSTHNPRDHNTRDHWRADRDRDRDRDFRDRRPSPPRRSPIREPRDISLNIDRARRNSRDGPPSAGSTYSDPPLGTSSSYRGSGIGRGRGTGRDFRGDFHSRGRGYHNDERDRYHDPRDVRDRMYRPRSRSREPVRRDRDIRDDRDFDRRDRDDRVSRFERREEEPRRYDSYLGSAGVKPGVRALDTHRGSIANESRTGPGTPTGPPTPHSAHHPATGDRLGPSVDSYSRRSSIATEPLSAKEARRESDRNDLIASRAEFSKERYAPRASSPPAAVPAFGFSNVWRNPALDAKPTPAVQAPKPVAPAPLVTAPAPAVTTPVAPPIPKPGIPSGLSTMPPTGPKADRLSDRPQGDIQPQPQESKATTAEQPRTDSLSRPSPTTSAQPSHGLPITEKVDPKPLVPVSSQANSPPLGPPARIRPPPTGPQGALRPNLSPSFPGPQRQIFAPRDASPGAIPSGPRNPLSINTSPKSAPVNIPTGPKADRANAMMSRPPMYTAPDRPPFGGPRMPLGGGPKSMQWVRPGLNRQSTVPSKREFPSEDRERTFGTVPKAPKLESSTSAADSQRSEPAKPEVPTTTPPTNEILPPKEQPLSDQPIKAPSPKASLAKIRRLSDISMPDASTHVDKPPISTALSAPEVMDDSDDDLDLDEDDFVESEAKYNRERALLESKRLDLSIADLRVTSLLQEITMLKSLGPEYLPGYTSKVVDEEMVDEEIRPPTPTRRPPESTTTELPTPKAEESDDVVMEDKQETPIAPATRALRLRQELSVERDSVPLDFSSLPYLGSGPPTPLSDPDHDRPSVPDSILLAIRNNLQKESAPERDPEDVLRQYAAVYKNWRLYVRELDGEKEQEDPERQPSTEPGLKATTPDIQSSAMAAMFEIPTTTGRRGHSNRFASEFDLEQVLKESIKTAEEERAGKKDKEPKKLLWDPEREATVPLQLTTYEVQRRQFIDTNFQREPGQGIFVYHYEPPEDDFTEEEHKIMVQQYRDQYAKKWGKLAEILYKEAGTSRTYKDTINHYYATKWNKEYKYKARRGGGRRQRGTTRAGRGRGAAANADRSEVAGDGGRTPLPLTDSGRPRRQAAPTFGTDPDLDPTAAVPTPKRQGRQLDVDGTQEKVSRRGKGGKEKGTRKSKNQPLAVAPAASPIKMDRNDRALEVKSEEELGKRPPEVPMVMPGLTEDQIAIHGDSMIHAGITTGIAERPRSHTNSRPGPSSYWSVTEQNDFTRNVAHFGTDWVAIADHMGTKTQTMVKNQYLRLVENGSSPGLKQMADEADRKRARGEELGPPPTPTPAPKRRYESSQTSLPRTLVPAPEAAELRSPPVQTNVPPKFSPPHSTSARFSTIAQAPPGKLTMQTAGSASVSEPSPLAALPSNTSQQPPPAQQPRAQMQHHQHSQSQSQQKTRHPAPPMGYFSDDFTPRMDRAPPQSSSSTAQPARSLQQQIQPQVRAQETAQAPLFRASIPQEREREPQARPEQPSDQDYQPRFQQHARRVSQELPYHRQFQPSAPSAAQIVPAIRSASGAGSPENRPLAFQQSRHITHPQQSVQTSPEVSSHSHGSVPPQLGSRPAVGTPPVKEEHRHYPLPPHPPHSQTPHSLQSQPPTYPQVSQPSAQSQVLPSAPKPATEPRKSNLLSLLNDTEPEEPRRKKPIDVPSHTPTPQQQAPIAPPPPVTQALPPRRDPFGEASNAQAPYSRQPYALQTMQPQPSSGRQIVDLTSEQPGSRGPLRESWQQRPTFHPGHSQAQQGASLQSPHASLVQPTFGDPRLFGNHRAFLAQHNAPRHNPSPPPHSAYSNSPHLHSRTPSLSGPASQPPRPSISNNPQVQSSQQPAPGTSQILQPNPYAQVDPPTSSSQPSGPVGMRPSPHLRTSQVAQQQREMQGRNEQSQGHNANLPYSNPQTPIEHPAHQHLRNASISEKYRHRDTREFHDFDRQNHERDVSRELSQRADVLLREQRDSLISRSVAPPQSHQDLRYQTPSQPDRGYPVQRSQTPLSRPEHAQHPSLQHGPPHSMLGDNSRGPYGQRQPEERYAYAPRDDRLTDRIREEQAHQQARMRGDDYLAREREAQAQAHDREMQELRARDVRYRDDMMRRDGRMPGPQPGGPPHGQQAQEQRPPTSGPPLDWTNGLNNRPSGERWQR